MDKNAYQNELNAVCFTEEGRAALTEALLNAQPSSRRQWSRKGLAVLVAAALLVGSAMAASGPVWDFFFGDLNDNQQAVIETLSQKLPPAKSNGTTMTPVAAFGDQDFYYLQLEITPPKSVTLPNYGKDEGCFYSFSAFDGDDEDEACILDSSGERLRVEWGYGWKERTSEKEPLTAIMMICSNFGAADFTDGTDKILHIPGLWVQTPDMEYIPILEGEWEFNIGAYTGGIESRMLDVSGITISSDDCDSMVLDSMRISPLGMYWRYHWIGPKNPRERVDAELVVALDDGSEILLADTVRYHYSECRCEAYSPFDAPIDLDHVASIRWGEAEIPFN